MSTDFTVIERLRMAQTAHDIPSVLEATLRNAVNVAIGEIEGLTKINRHYHNAFMCTSATAYLMEQVQQLERQLSELREWKADMLAALARHDWEEVDVQLANARALDDG